MPKSFYSAEVRKQATEAALNRGDRPMREIAEEQGVTVSSLNYWLQLERGSKGKKKKAGKKRKQSDDGLPETGYLDPAERLAAAMRVQRRMSKASARQAELFVDKPAHPATREVRHEIVVHSDADPVPRVLEQILKLSKLQRLRVLAALRAIYGQESRE